VAWKVIVRGITVTSIAGYFSDLVVPFGFYFLLCAAELQMPRLRGWRTKAAVTFAVPAVAETCQFFGIPVLGSTFDPVDYLMYGAGALLAALVDVRVLPKHLPRWNDVPTS
jgi:hypothetical protein